MTIWTRSISLYQATTRRYSTNCVRGTWKRRLAEIPATEVSTASDGCEGIICMSRKYDCNAWRTKPGRNSSFIARGKPARRATPGKWLINIDVKPSDNSESREENLVATRYEAVAEIVERARACEMKRGICLFKRDV